MQEPNIKHRMNFKQRNALVLNVAAFITKIIQFWSEQMKKILESVGVRIRKFSCFILSSQLFQKYFCTPRYAHVITNTHIFFRKKNILNSTRNVFINSLKMITFYIFFFKWKRIMKQSWKFPKELRQNSKQSAFENFSQIAYRRNWNWKYTKDGRLSLKYTRVLKYTGTS